MDKMDRVERNPNIASVCILSILSKPSYFFPGAYDNTGKAMATIRLPKMPSITSNNYRVQEKGNVR